MREGPLQKPLSPLEQSREQLGSSSSTQRGPHLHPFLQSIWERIPGEGEGEVLGILKRKVGRPHPAVNLGCWGQGQQGSHWLLGHLRTLHFPIQGRGAAPAPLSFLESRNKGTGPELKALQAVRTLLLSGSPKVTLEGHCGHRNPHPPTSGEGEALGCWILA